MQAIEFTSKSHDRMIPIPEHYNDWFKKPVKIIKFENLFNNLCENGIEVDWRHIIRYKEQLTHILAPFKSCLQL